MTEAPTGGGARLMLGFAGTEATPELGALLHETGARSLVLFARNLTGAAQAQDLVASLRALVPWPLLIAVDQEGGAVVRLTDGVTVFPGNMALGAAGDAALARAQGRASGLQLAALGFDLNLAPVVDLQTNPQNPGIGIRSLGSELDAALPLARALIDGHAESGVASCLKHFPGKGAASVDAHLDLPVIDLPEEEFRARHLAIFAELVGADPRLACMTTHVRVPALADEPATASRELVTGLLRGELGFRGLVLADDLEMGGVTEHGRVPDAALRAAVAGHDCLPICHSPELQREAAALLDAALGDGRLDPAEHAAALARIDALAGGAGAGPLVDRAEGDAVAAEIAARAVCCLGDPRGLLPVPSGASVLVLAARPHSIVGVEEEAERDFAALCARLCAPLGAVEVESFETSLEETEAEALCARGAVYDRVLLFSWNASGESGMRFLLDLACRRLCDRLVVVHLRNPFDQALVPESSKVSALTAFGYRISQLASVAKVLRGDLAPQGRFPAPWK